MARRSAADIAIAVTSDVTDAATGFDKVGRSATDMADQVDKASRDVDKATDRLGSAADTADDLAGKTGKATGAMGALAGGLEAVGLEKYAAGLQAAGVATDFASGAGDLFNLVMTSSTVLTIKDRAAKIAHAVATKATTAATIAATVAQKALNLALRLNPIGLIITLIAALVAGFILAYKKSETFRNIVDGAMAGAKKAIGFVVDKARDLWEALQTLKDKADPILDKLQTLFGRVFDAILVPIKAVKDAVDSIIEAVQKVIDKIGSIRMPDLPDLNPFSRSTLPGIGRTPTTARTGATAPTVQINVTGALDPDAVARQIRRLLERHSYRVGNA